MIHASLFSGIGACELAASQLGWQNAFSCEIDPFCRRVLAYHFPDATQYGDIRTTDFSQYANRIDVLSGGFPCQPFSLAGKRKGTEDDRYLWPEMLRVIRQVRPAWIVGENVAGILSMVQPGDETIVDDKTDLFGARYIETEERQQYVADKVCHDLERAGYSVRPFVIPACAVGAPHRRDRVWFVAHRSNARAEGLSERRAVAGESDLAPDPGCVGCGHGLGDWKGGCVCGVGERQAAENKQERDERLNRTWENGNARTAPHAESEPSERLQPRQQNSCSKEQGQLRGDGCEDSAGRDDWHAHGELLEARDDLRQQGRLSAPGSKPSNFPYGWAQFPTQSPVCSGDDGLSARLDGITFSKWRDQSVKAYGNSMCVAVVYEIFRAINIAQQSL